jgi:hypothetical protein
VPSGDGDEFCRTREEGIHHIRVEVAAVPFADDLQCLVQGKRLLVGARGDQRVKDIGQRHQASRDRDRVTGQSVRIPGTIPLFVMGKGDLLGHAQEGDRLFGFLFGLFERLEAEAAVGFHDRILVCRQLAGFEQDVVRNTHLADVVQGCRFDQQFDVVGRQKGGEPRMRAQFHGQGAYVALRTPQVVAGFRVADLCQTRQGANADVLDAQGVGHPPRHLLLQAAVAVVQPVAGGFQFEVGLDPCADDRRPDRLGNVIDGAKGETSLLVVTGFACGDEYHRDVGRAWIGLQALDHLIAVESRHHHVEQDQIGSRFAVGNAQRALSRTDGTYPVVTTE